MDTLKINDWKVFFHACFDAQLETLKREVELLQQSHPDDYKTKRPAKLLAAITKQIKDIASNPMDVKFRQGDTLGKSNKHWFRAKFLQQYRLFFRFNVEHKTIVIAWVNDEKTLRAYDSREDAYKVFEGMLKKGNPPSDWNALLSKSINPPSD